MICFGVQKTYHTVCFSCLRLPPVFLDRELLLCSSQFLFPKYPSHAVLSRTIHYLVGAAPSVTHGCSPELVRIAVRTEAQLFVALQHSNQNLYTFFFEASLPGSRPVCLSQTLSRQPRQNEIAHLQRRLSSTWLRALASHQPRQEQELEQAGRQSRGWGAAPRLPEQLLQAARRRSWSSN